MIDTRQRVYDLVQHHVCLNAREKEAQLEMLQFLKTAKQPYHRAHIRGGEELAPAQDGGHMTASAVIVNAKRTHVVLVHHAALNTWLVPGGHCDGDPDIWANAEREVEEETGLTGLTLLSEGLFNVENHPIPERPAKGEGVHVHFDIALLYEYAGDQALVVSEESHAVKWVAFEDVPIIEPDGMMWRIKQRLLAL